MNEVQVSLLLEMLERIAMALEKGSEGGEHFTSEQMERMLVVQEKNAAVSEQRLEIERQHNELHLRGTAHEQSN